MYVWSLEFVTHVRNRIGLSGWPRRGLAGLGCLGHSLLLSSRPVPRSSATAGSPRENRVLESPAGTTEDCGVRGGSGPGNLPRSPLFV